MPRPPSSYRETRLCETCGNPFQFAAFPSNIKLGRGRFCSKDCQSVWQAIPLADRFRLYVGPTTDRGCVLWIGTRNDDGYGVIGSGGMRGRMILAHRVAWELENGAITDDLKVLHKCDNPPCINVAHLFLGTVADNIHDMVAKGRCRKRTPGSRRYLQEQRRCASQAS